ncbi:MAG: nucleotidyl transferase AbiEii/AbiGii toxin family protein [Saprospiraceae bacterium]|nr:nucleotidyl transferase AbiEii/AbiGii toxin family protein [Saprospiraceae bacterium]
MMPLAEIEKQYPPNLRAFGPFLLREYLQYQILQVVFNGKYAQKFCFLGGTCLRIIYQNTRFSEDLDFDNFDLSTSDFDQVADEIGIELRKLGLNVELENVFRGAYHCYIKFPGLLYQTGLSGHKDQKILIQLDTENQGFAYQPKLKFINKFDVFCSVPTTPQDILLAQKFYAVFNRKQPKGRDFFDITFLMGLDVKPNYAFLEQKTGISNPEMLRERILDHCKTLDFEYLANDVRAFLFNANDVRRVLLFSDFMKQAAL